MTILLTFACGGCVSVGGLENYLENGFKVGPNYRKPVAKVAETWIDDTDPDVSKQPPRCQDWWQVFNDLQLTALVQTTYRENLTLREAGMRVLESRAQRDIAVGSIFPQQQQAVGSFRRRQFSETSLENRPLLAEMVPREFDRSSIGFDAAWELDFWGKFRRNVESADALLDASIEQYDDVLVTLIAETAAVYVELRTAQERLRYAKANVQSQEGLLGIAQSRFDAGETDDLDVLQATINLKNTEALIPQLEEIERKAQIRLSVLMGQPPRDLSPELGTGGIPQAPSTVALGIPADLLRRRPDVRKAERDVAAQSEQIGVAAAALLPQISIRGTIGYDAENVSDLFRASSASGVIGPSFTWDLLNYGRLENNILLQDAKFQQEVLHYQETVLQANADVERAVVSYLQAMRRVTPLQGAVAANQEAVKIATDQYKQGEVNFEQLFTLQSSLVQEQDALASAEGDVARGLISIYKALGGGWQIRLDCHDNLRTPTTPPVERDPPPRLPQHMTEASASHRKPSS